MRTGDKYRFVDWPDAQYFENFEDVTIVTEISGAIMVPEEIYIKVYGHN